MEKTKGRFAGTVRVGEKGQIVIPKGARELLKIRPGDTLLLLADEKRGIAITKDDVLLRQFEAMQKMMKKAKRNPKGFMRSMSSMKGFR